MICIVTGIITNADGTPNTDVQIIATIESQEPDQGGQMAGSAGITSDPVETFTADDGSFAVSLIQGTRVLLHIPSINLRKLILIPALSTVDFSTLI